MEDSWDLDEPAFLSAGEPSGVSAVKVLATPVPEHTTPSCGQGPELAPIVVASPSSVEMSENSAAGMLKRLENEVCADALGVIAGAMAFADVLTVGMEPLEEIPEGWVEKYGAEGARRRFITARAACMSAKTAPVALKMAQQTAVGAMAALDRAKVSAPVFNLQFVQMIRPATYDEIEIVESE